MAASGWTMQQVLMFSKHRDVDQLQVYLNQGSFAGGDAAVAEQMTRMQFTQTQFPW